MRLLLDVHLATSKLEICDINMPQKGYDGGTTAIPNFQTKMLAKINPKFSLEILSLKLCDIHHGFIVNIAKQSLIWMVLGTNKLLHMYAY